MITIPKTGHGMSELNSRRRYLDLNDVLIPLRDELDLLGTTLSLLTREKKRRGDELLWTLLKCKELTLINSSTLVKKPRGFVWKQVSEHTTAKVKPMLSLLDKMSSGPGPKYEAGYMLSGLPWWLSW